MKIYRSKLALAMLLAMGVTACGGSSGSNNNNDDGDNGGGDDGDDGGSVISITSDPADLSGRGKWGSLVISGYGEINNADDNDQTTTEAVPDGVTRWFGGTDNDDSSGSIRYVILAETGEAFRPDEEVQGLTIEGSGAGTTISHVQVTNSDDDGIEWFGGAASADHVVIQGVTDDSLDMDLGYQGTVQFGLIRQGANFGDRIIESDNNGSDFGALPKTTPILANITLFGNAGNGGTGDANTMGALHREGMGGQLYRSVIADDSEAGAQFDLGCLDVDDELDEDLEYGDVLFNCAAGGLVDDTDDGAGGQSYQEDFSNSGRYGVIDGPAGYSVDSSTLAVNTSESIDGTYSAEFTTPSGQSVTPTDYFGAVDPASETAWWEGWTYRNSGIEGNLPGSDFHPLEAEISDGTIAAASSNNCADVGNGLEVAEDVEIFGNTFPVCVIRDGDLDGDFTLTNDHIYVLDGTVQVGNGDVESAFDPSTVREDVLTIEEGTQIFGISDTDPSLVITRGSRIEAEGTADMPIVFGAVDAEES